jgi:plasmid stabilization system protein ParE
MKIRITAAAEQDLADGHDFYERQQEGLGTYFLDSLFSDIDSLLLYAGIHSKPIGRFHRTLSKRFPFAIYYEFQGGVATVVAVLDCRRNPASIVARLDAS